eukprot:CAMPEP_0116886494 /NCGR_PEP_ID=MMETSP0463-20121206/20377_1 /TAXON_ID=181622 /ORGANISM="Strombidinopsis sp, Strain SopsisLIS2011" /LENGTH=78 /DNA_ID=CAMNT_0004547037 /DNA_START=21 /DNA_END=257 /DNA_ORIENTATION=+
MGKANKTRKFATVKRMINPKDNRLQIATQSKEIKKQRGKDDKHDQGKKSKLNEMKIHQLEKAKVGLFFEHNTQLGPPY